MPSTTMLRTSSAVGSASASTSRRRFVRGGELLGQPATASRKSRESSPVTPRTSGLMPSASAFAVSRSCSASSTVSASSISMIGMSRRARVAALEARVVQRVLVGEVEQRALVLGAREDLEQLRVERHASTLLRSGQDPPRTSASTSAVCASHAARSGASRFRRSSGSVLLGRRLNHQSPKSTVSPSSRSCCASA